MRRHLDLLALACAAGLTGLAALWLVFAPSARAQPTTAPTDAAVMKTVSTSNLTANLSTGNRTLTIASGGTLNAVAGSNIILAGTTTLSGNITSNATVTGGTLSGVAIAGNSTLAGNLTSNATVTQSGALTVTGNTTLGNVTVPANRTFTFSNVSGEGYSYPVQWGGGAKYSLAGGTATFNGVEDYNGGIQYNAARTAGWPVFVLGFEDQYNNTTLGVDTEFYYNWDKPVGTSTDAGGVASRRVFQTNVSLGTQKGAPPGKPTGFAQWSFDVNKFTVDNGSNFNGEFAIDFTSSPKRLTWQNAMTLNGALTIGGAITQSGTNTNTLSGATTINASNASYAFATSETDALSTYSNTSGDAGARFIRGSSTGEHITIGAAAGGGIFGGSPAALSNAFAIQRTGNTTIRDLVFRRYDGTTYTVDGRLTAAGLWVLGSSDDDTVNRLQVAGNALFTAANGNTVRILNSALGAGDAGIWFNDAGTASSTNYGISGSGTNTIVNSPNGSILFRNANNDRATLSSTGLALESTTQATSTTAASLKTKGGLGVVKKSFFGDDIALVPETDSSSSIFFSGTTVASNPGIWFKQATPSGTNYAFMGSATTTHLNAPSGGTLRLRVANGNYVALTASAFQVENVPITLPSTDGSGYIQVVEQSSSPAAGSANSARIYAKDNGSGKTQLIVRFASGAEQVLATEP
jgi:hypothetical protein